MKYQKPIARNLDDVLIASGGCASGNNPTSLFNCGGGANNKFNNCGGGSFTSNSGVTTCNPTGAGAVQCASYGSNATDA